jgi:hypothetical protein
MVPEKPFPARWIWLMPVLRGGAPARAGERDPCARPMPRPVDSPRRSWRLPARSPNVLGGQEKTPPKRGSSLREETPMIRPDKGSKSHPVANL